MQKKWMILVLLMSLISALNAQSIPYAWTFSAKKISDRTFEIHFVAEVKPPWHTYSQYTPDGGPIPTHFEFFKNPLCTLVGAVKENGKLMTRHEEVFGVDVKYFEGRVDFVQVVKMKTGAKTNFSGSINFMVCNDEQCLPPTTQKFSVALN